MTTQYDKISNDFKNADKEFSDITRPILYSLIKKENGSLLDLGCGYGEDLSYFHKKGFDVYGIDISKEMIKESKKNCKKASLNVASFGNLPYDKNKFDIIFSRYAFQHSNNIEPIFNEVYRTLKKDGELIFLVTHPFRQYFEKQTKDYWKQEKCTSSILGGKVTVEEPSHILNEYINAKILSKFSLENMIEEFDPAAEKKEDCGKYPSILILKYKKI